MKAVILAGGRGTRISEESHLRPKPMIKIGDMPILWHIMKTYHAHGISDFVICLGYRGYMIKEYFANYALHSAEAVTFDLRKDAVEISREGAEPWRITLIETGMETQTGGRIKRIARWISDDEAFCLTYGDGLSNVNITDLLTFHKHHGKKASVTTVIPAGRFGAMDTDGDRVIKFSEKSTSSDAKINGGYFVLSPEVLDYIEEDSTIWERKPLELLAAENELRAFHHDGFWQPMDTMRERDILQDMWADGSAPWRIW